MRYKTQLMKNKHNLLHRVESVVNSVVDFISKKFVSQGGGCHLMD